jgi:hypothetical protein
MVIFFSFLFFFFLPLICSQKVPTGWAVDLVKKGALAQVFKALATHPNAHQLHLDGFIVLEKICSTGNKILQYKEEFFWPYFLSLLSEEGSKELIEKGGIDLVFGASKIFHSDGELLEKVGGLLFKFLEDGKIKTTLIEFVLMSS